MALPVTLRTVLPSPVAAAGSLPAAPAPASLYAPLVPIANEHS